MKQYRRKRASNLNRPVDNLHVEEGSLKTLKTEYNRRFQAPATELISSHRSNRPQRVEDWQMDGSSVQGGLQGEYRDKFLDFPRERPRVRRPGSQLKTDGGPMDFRTEQLEKFVPFPNAERSKSLRRATALKSEGELFAETETQREFHPHKILDRVCTLKRPSNLKLEGLFETLTSEQKEKYIAYLSNRRQTVVKRGTELKLFGDFDFATECRVKYVDPGTQPRPFLRKRSTSLKLDGETEFAPEYRRNFVDFPRTRPSIPRPREHLYSEGELDLGTESHSQFVQLPISHVPKSPRAPNNIQLEGELVLNPEYREQFVSHGKSKSEIIRRPDNLNLEGNFTFETEKDKYRCHNTPIVATGDPTTNGMDEKSSEQKETPLNFLSNSEYHSQFVDFPRNRPRMSKPSANLRSNGPSEMTTEKRSQYRSYGTIPRTTPRRRPANLTPDGGVEGEAEYKNKYIQFPVSFHKSPKPVDCFPREYPSFQVIDVRQPGGPPLERLQPSLTPTPPSYRLQVHDVDNKPRGFHRSPERIFPPEAVVSKSSPEIRNAALEAAMKRRKSHERNTSSGRGRASPNRNDLKGLSRVDENGNEKSFTVVDNIPNTGILNNGQPWSPEVLGDSGGPLVPPSSATLVN